MGQFAEGHLLQQLIDSTSGLWRKNIRFGLMDWQISTVSMQIFIIFLILQENVKKMPLETPQTQQSMEKPTTSLDIGSLVVHMFASWNFRCNTITKPQTGYPMAKPMIPSRARKVRPLRSQYGPRVVTSETTTGEWNTIVFVKVQTEWKKNVRV